MRTFIHSLYKLKDIKVYKLHSTSILQAKSFPTINATLVKRRLTLQKAVILPKHQTFSFYI
jgi:hypothetical protein